MLLLTGAGVLIANMPWSQVKIACEVSPCYYARKERDINK
jgi:hypothetical protein